ncbi:thyrotropin-releasing hormone receptor-like [Lytechinus pictus]|uniref:thyrotropin-releasing hormone receptor-like n=1 Tax=Lytechinus pictus TaxID=7653 RepID=UPI00240DE2C4|nr:thyrotropin-releasing hormone receptor-like [Lytechinus pictus]
MDGITVGVVPTVVTEVNVYQTVIVDVTPNMSLLSPNATRALPELEYYTLDYKIIATIFYLILGAAAIIGNAMVIIVVLRVSHMRTPTNCYLVSLAIADSMVGAITIMMHSVPENLLPKNAFIYGAAGCHSIIALEYLAFNVSALSITAFTIERYIAICHPMKAHIICSVSRATKIIITLWVFEIIYCSQWCFLLEYREQEYVGGHIFGRCWYHMDKVAYINGVYLVDCFLYYIVPVGVCIPLYAIIGRVLFRSTMTQNGIRRGYEVGSREKENGNTTRLRLMKSNEGSNGSNSPRRCKDSGSTAVSSRKQVIKMLVIVVALFGILWAPYRMLVVFNWFNTPAKQYYNEWFLFFCRTCLYLNSVVNPVLYNFMSIKFRRAFTKLCTCRGKNDRLAGGRSSIAGSFTGQRRTSTACTAVTSNAHTFSC